MRKHNGMRPQDVVVLMKILTSRGRDWQFKDLAWELNLSGSEIFESLNRSHVAGLVDQERRQVFRQSLIEFLIHGIHYVFPQLPGSMVNGMRTAHSHPWFSAKFSSEFIYVWPDPGSNERGLAIEPLYAGQIKAAIKDEKLYGLLAAVDILRVGRTRESNLAKEILEKEILYEL